MHRTCTHHHLILRHSFHVRSEWSSFFWIQRDNACLPSIKGSSAFSTSDGACLFHLSHSPFNIHFPFPLCSPSPLFLCPSTPLHQMRQRQVQPPYPSPLSFALCRNTGSSLEFLPGRPNGVTFAHSPFVYWWWDDWVETIHFPMSVFDVRSPADKRLCCRELYLWASPRIVTL